MRYVDGQLARVGDLIQIDEQYRGRVIACIDTGEYMPGEESWEYLKVGMMVDTDFGGLVHYTPEFAEGLVLLERNPAS